MSELDFESRLAALEAEIKRLRGPELPELHMPPEEVPGSFLTSTGASFDAHGRVVSDHRLIVLTGRDVEPRERNGEDWIRWRIGRSAYATIALRDPRFDLALGPIEGTGLVVRDAVEGPGRIWSYEPGPLMAISTLIVIARRRASAGPVQVATGASTHVR